MDFTRQSAGVLCWCVLAVLSLWPRPNGLKFAIAGLVIALLYCLGPMGEAGVIDFRSYLHHAYLQPGLFMTLDSGGLVLGRLWIRARRGRFRSRGMPWFDLATVGTVLAIAAVVHYERSERAPDVFDRMRISKQTTPAELSRLMLAIADDYPAYGHAEGEMNGDYRFAPSMCRSPGGPVGRISASEDSATHGGKLYTMYARDRRAYMSLYLAREYEGIKGMEGLRQDQPVGQIIVKESFTPREVGDDEPRLQGIRPAFRGGKYFLPAERRDLFVMVNLGPDVIGTDGGWVYGTVSRDFRNVTSAGRVDNCMRCHDSATNGRVFGLPLTPDDSSPLPSTVPTTR